MKIEVTNEELLKLLGVSIPPGHSVQTTLFEKQVNSVYQCGVTFEVWEDIDEAPDD